MGIKSKLFHGLKIFVLSFMVFDSIYLIMVPLAALAQVNVQEVTNTKPFQEIERIDLRTPYAKIFQIGENRFRYEANVDKIHFGTPGSYQEVNNNVISDAEGRFNYRNAANDFNFRAGNTLDKGVLYSSGKTVCEFRLYEVDDNSNKSIPLNNSSAIVKGNVITYPNIYADADLEFTVLSTGVRTEVVAKNAGALKAEYEFELINCDNSIFDAPTMSDAKDGAIIEGKVVEESEIDEIEKIEPKKSEERIENQESLKSELTLEAQPTITEEEKTIAQKKAKKVKKLVLRPDYSKLGQINGEVRIDPTITRGSTMDTFVSPGTLNPGNGARRFMPIGTYTDYTLPGDPVFTQSRALMHFGTINNLPSGSMILNSKLQLWHYGTNPGNGALYVAKVTGGWDEGTVWGGPGFTGDYGSATFPNYNSNSNAQFREITLNPVLVDEFRAPNNGLMVKNYNDFATGVVVCSKEIPSGPCQGGMDPKLVFEYMVNNPPYTPNPVAPINSSQFSGNCNESVIPATGVCRSPIAVTTTVHGLGDGDPIPGHYRGTVFNYTTVNNSQTTSFSTPENQSAPTAPNAALSNTSNFPDGITTWNAVSYDHQSLGGNPSPSLTFQTDSTPPIVPTAPSLPEFTPGVGIDSTVQVDFAGNKTTDNVSSQANIFYQLQYSTFPNFSTVFTKPWQQDNPRFELGPKGIDLISGTADDIVNGNTYYFRIKARDLLNNTSAWNDRDINGNILKTTIDGIKPVIDSLNATEERISPSNSTSTGYKDSVDFNLTYTEKYPKIAALNIYASTDTSRTTPLKTISKDLVLNPGTPTGTLDQYSLLFNWDGRNNANAYLADGPYISIISVEDKATNQAKSLEGIIIIDNSSANITISSPQNDYWTNKNDFPITGQATAPNLPNAEDGDLQKIEIKRLLDSAWQLISLDDPSLPENDPNLGIFNIKPGNPLNGIYPLTLGQNSFELRTTDTVGNKESINHSINYETTPPVISSVQPNTLSNNRKPTITYTLTDPDPTSDGLQRSDLRVGTNPLNTKVWLTYTTYNPTTSNYDLQTKVLIDNGVNLDTALVGNLNCIAASNAQSSTKNGVAVANIINCTLPFIADLQPDSTYTIHIDTKDLAGNNVLKEDVSFILDSHIYSELSAPINGSTYSTSSVLFKGKSSKNSSITIRNEELNREKTFILNEALDNTGTDDPSDPNRLITSNFVIVCGQFRDIDGRVETKEEELCSWEVRVLQKHASIDIDTANTNKITIKDTALNSVVHSSTFNVNLFGFDLTVSSDLNFFSPNGDGNQDGVKFSHTAINPTDATSPPDIANYKLEIKNSSGVTVREFNGTGSLPSNTFWDGKQCNPANLPPSETSDSVCNYVIDGEYKFTLTVITTDGITITTDPQALFAKTVLLDEVVITSPKDKAVTTKGVITIEGQAPKAQNTEGSLNPLRGKVYVDICIDTIGTEETCDFSTTLTAYDNGYFSTLATLPRLDNAQTLHNITAKARDDFGNSTKISNTVQVILDTIDPFKSVKITPVLTGINTAEDYQKFLNGEIGIDKLRTLRLSAELTQNTEGLQYSFAEYVNVNKRPENPSFNYIATVNDLKENNLRYNPYDLATVKKNYNKALGDPSIPAANCSITSCIWEYNLAAQPNWGGIYEVEFKAKKGDRIQSLTAGFKADGNIPAAPIIMIVERWDDTQDTWVTLNPYESKYYTNKTKVRLRGAAEPNINLQLSVNNTVLPSFKSSVLGIWEKEIDYSTLLNLYCKEYQDSNCGLADLDIKLKAYKTDSGGNITYEIPSVNNAFIVYDSIAPKATAINRITPANTITGWAQTGMPVQYTTASNEKLFYADLIGEDGFVRLLTNSSLNTWLGVINANRESEGYYNPQLRIVDLAGNITRYDSKDPIFLQPDSVIKDWRIYIDNTKPESTIIDKAGWGIDNGIKADGVLPEEGRLNPEYVVKAKSVIIKGRAEKEQRVEIHINNRLHTTINVSENNCQEVASYEKRVTIDNLIVKDNILCDYSYEYVFPSNGRDEFFGAPKESYVVQVRVIDKAANYSGFTKQEIVYHDEQSPFAPEIYEMSTGLITKQLSVTFKTKAERFADYEFWKYGPKGELQEYRLLRNTSSGLLDQTFNMGTRRDDTDPKCMVMKGLRRTGICEDGFYTFKFKATDAPGNPSQITTIVIERDTVAPKVPDIVNVNRKSPTRELNVTIKTLIEERTEVRYFKKGSRGVFLSENRVFTNSDNGYSDQFFKLGNSLDEGKANCIRIIDFRRLGLCEDGNYGFSLNATDAAGNTSDTASTGLERDTVAPEKPNVSRQSTGFATQNSDITLTTQSEKTADIEFNYQPHSRSKYPRQYQLYSDHPNVEITRNYKLGTRRDDSVSNCIQMIGSRRTGICEDGANLLSMKATDVAGNISVTNNINLEMDTVRPAKPSIQLTKSGSEGNEKVAVSIKGEAYAKATIRISSSKGFQKTVVVNLDENGNYYSSNISGTLSCPDIDNYFSVVLNDAAGNQSDTAYASVKSGACPKPTGTCTYGGNALGYPVHDDRAKITSGYRTVARPDHDAVDIALIGGPEVSWRADIYASAPGKVTHVKQQGGYPGAVSGNHVIVKHDDGKETVYYHLDNEGSNVVNKEDRVGPMTVVGHMGNTGNIWPRPDASNGYYPKAGTHLHYALFVNGRDVDPENYIGSRYGSVECKEEENGGGGSDDSGNYEDDYIDIGNTDFEINSDKKNLWDELWDGLVDLSEIVKRFTEKLYEDFVYLYEPVNRHCDFLNLVCEANKVDDFLKRIIPWEWNYLWGILKGAGESVVGTVEQIVEFVKNPPKVISQLIDTVKEIFNDPTILLKLLGGEIERITNLSPQERIHEIGKIIGAFVPDALVAIITAGGSTGVSAGKKILDALRTTGKFADKVVDIAEFVGKTVKFGKKKIDVKMKKIGSKLGIGGSDIKKLLHDLNDSEFDKVLDQITDPNKKKALKKYREALKKCGLAQVNQKYAFLGVTTAYAASACTTFPRDVLDEILNKGGDIAETLRYAKDGQGRFRWLENGNDRYGWEHILQRHYPGYPTLKNKGKLFPNVPQNEIQDLIFKAIKEGTYSNDGDHIYELSVKFSDGSSGVLRVVSSGRNTFKEGTVISAFLNN